MILRADTINGVTKIHTDDIPYGERVYITGFHAEINKMRDGDPPIYGMVDDYEYDEIHDHYGIHW